MVQCSVSVYIYSHVFWVCLYGQPIHHHYTVHRLVLPSNGTATCVESNILYNTQRECIEGVCVCVLFMCVCAHVYEFECVCVCVRARAHARYPPSVELSQ